MFRVMSYGKESPQCSSADEQCWQLNRRAHITADGGSRPNSD
jgi:outer membrane protein OmpA-like peptidoglycan-associated protein